MRLVCPYEPDVHPLSRSSLEQFTATCEYVKLGDRPVAYWVLLQHLWSEGESFAIVEHDVEIHDRVERSFRYCSKPWCVFPYSGPSNYGAGSGVLFDEALGCTRFRSTLIAQFPDLLSSIDPSRRDWRGLDSQIAGRLRALGYRAHVHGPPVTHHHRYPAGCACGRDHD